MIDTAADALLLGVADPLGYLAAGREDWTILAAVVQRAAHLRGERRLEEFRALAKLIANELSRILS